MSKEQVKELIDEYYDPEDVLGTLEQIFIHLEIELEKRV